MSSQQRSSSGVRDLRAMFEKKDPADSAATDTPDRGRSPSSASARAESTGPHDKSPAAGARRIRANFVGVDGTSGSTDQKPVINSMANRRPSMSLDDQQDKEALSELKTTVSNEYERRKSIPQLPETVPEMATTSAMPTPIPEEGKRLGDSQSPTKPIPVPTGDKQSEHPHKPVSAVEDPAKLTPADVKDKGAVTGGKALGLKSGPKPNMTGAKNPQKGKATVAKPPNLSTARRPPEGPSARSPQSSKGSPKVSRPPQAAAGSSNQKSPPQRKSSGGQSARPRSPTRPVPLPSHLTAPTAASAAKHGPEPKRESTGVSKKSVELPARLTAPTASSKAKHDDISAPAATAPSKKPSRASMAPRSSLGPAPTATRKAPASSRHSMAPTTNASRARNVSNPSSSQAPLKKSTQPSEGFLARMMKPTASSTRKHQDKSEPNSPTHKSEHDPAHAKSSGEKAEQIKSPAANVANEAKKAAKPQTNGLRNKPSREAETKEARRKDGALKPDTNGGPLGTAHGANERLEPAASKTPEKSKEPSRGNAPETPKPVNNEPPTSTKTSVKKAPASSAVSAETKPQETKSPTEGLTENIAEPTKPATPAAPATSNAVPEKSNGVASHSQGQTDSSKDNEFKTTPLQLAAEPPTTPVQTLDGSMDSETTHAPAAAGEQSKPEAKTESNGGAAPLALTDKTTPSVPESKPSEPPAPTSEPPSAKEEEPTLIGDVGETY